MVTPPPKIQNANIIPKAGIPQLTPLGFVFGPGIKNHGRINK